tara:strand:+ start:498 stop:1418 length:921 start_codon:yes stop_codon:yes gene_type:complete
MLNYYELEPENNHFNDVCVDVTHRCNMKCKNCYVPNREIPDMDIDKLIDCLSKFPKRASIRIIGAEPTMRSDLPDIISRIKALGHRQILLTNGLRLARAGYVEKLKKAGLTHVYLSLNGADNDDWYETIDEMPCAVKKVKALQNLVKNKMIIQTGTIIVRDVNETAPKEMVRLFNQVGLKNVVMRIKNVGQIGRYMNGVEENLKMDDLVDLVCSQLNLDKDYVNTWRDKPILDTLEPEPNSFMFPADPNSAGKNLHRSGLWIKLANWDTENDSGIPSPNSLRRGRITENFKVAPFFEHVKLNEGGY